MSRKQTVAAKRQDEVDAVVDTLEQAISGVIDLHAELEEARSNMEEKFSETEKYQRLDELVTTLDEIKCELETQRDNLQGVQVDYVNR